MATYPYESMVEYLTDLNTRISYASTDDESLAKFAPLITLDAQRNMNGKWALAASLTDFLPFRKALATQDGKIAPIRKVTDETWQFYLNNMVYRSALTLGDAVGVMPSVEAQWIGVGSFLATIAYEITSFQITNSLAERTKKSVDLAARQFQTTLPAVTDALLDEASIAGSVETLFKKLNEEIMIDPPIDCELAYLDLVYLLLDS